MGAKEARNAFAMERELIGLWEWLPVYSHSPVYGSLVDICGVKVVEGFPPVDEKDILFYDRKRGEQRWEWQFCGGGADWVGGRNRREMNRNLNALVLRAYSDHSDEELWGKLIALSEREHRRIKEGVWIFINGKPTFLPPNYYFALTYVPNKEGKPLEYIDSTRESYLFRWWLLVTGQRGDVQFMRRQSGKSIELGSDMLWISMLVRDENFMVQSMDEMKLDVLYSTCIERPYNELPMIMARHHRKMSTSDGLYFGAPPQRSDGDKNAHLTNRDTLSSRITEYAEGMVLKAGKDKLAADSFTLMYLGVDEFGKMRGVDILSRHLVSAKAAKYMHYCSTVEMMNEEQIETLMKFWAMSDRRVYPDETPTKLSRIFISSVRGYVDATTRGTNNEIRFVDRYGNSMMEEAYRYLTGQRSAMSALGANYLIEEVRKVPLLAEEMFIPDVGSGALNSTLLQRRKHRLDNARLLGSPVVSDVIDEETVETPIGYPVRLEWRGGERFSEVVAIPDDLGDFIMVYPPEKANNIASRKVRRINHNTNKEEEITEYVPLYRQGKGFGARYGAGIDPYHFDHTSDEGSKGGITILDNDRSDPRGYRPVLYYCKRTGKTDDFYMKALMAMWFYGCTGAIDKKSEDAMRWFDALGCLQFLEGKKIGVPTKAVSMAVAMQRGENTSGERLYEYTKLLADYVEAHSDRLNIQHLILQLQKWRLGKDKTTNKLDGAFSFALALYNCLVPSYAATREAVLEKSETNWWGVVHHDPNDIPLYIAGDDGDWVENPEAKRALALREERGAQPEFMDAVNKYKHKNKGYG